MTSAGSTDRVEPGGVRTRYAEANGLTLAYETFGDPSDPPVLMVMGLGTQMLAWPDEMCAAIAERGAYVVRFDNRDVGLSTHLDGQRVPPLQNLLLRRASPPYAVDDMADDAVALLDALGIDAAHLVGASMGGFIAQTVALRHPGRVRSLALVMTSTGSRFVGWPAPTLLRRLTTGRSVSSREEAQDAAVETFRLIGSPGYPFDEEHVRDLAGRSYDRAHDPAGYLRQLAAVLTQRNRTKDLAGIRVPTVVVHGLDDPLVHSSGGRAIAKAVPGARFVGIPGMGHDLPRAVWPQLVNAVCTVVSRASTSR